MNRLVKILLGFLLVLSFTTTSKSRSVGGTGLGLAIVKHLVSQHRGEMIINSEKNQGTTIDLKFNSI